MGKNVDLCDKLRDRRYPNSKEKRFVRWKKIFSLLLKIIIIIVSARMLGAILSVENSVVIEDTVVSFIYPVCRKTPCFSYGDIRHFHRIYASN